MPGQKGPQHIPGTTKEPLSLEQKEPKGSGRVEDEVRSDFTGKFSRNHNKEIIF